MSDAPATAPATDMQRSTAWLLVAVWFAALLAVRVAAPSDIHDKHQFRTIGYTADMLERGRWFMPYDSTGTAATKPVLYNWIAAPFVAAVGPLQWTHTLPSALAAGAAALVVLPFAAWLLRDGPRWRWDLGAAAACMWLGSHATFSMM